MTATDKELNEKNLDTQCYGHYNYNDVKYDQGKELETSMLEYN